MLQHKRHFCSTQEQHWRLYYGSEDMPGQYMYDPSSLRSGRQLESSGGILPFFFFQVSNTAQYNILFYKTLTTYMIQYLGIFRVILTISIGKRVHLSFYSSVTLEQSYWSPPTSIVIAANFPFEPQHSFRTAPLQETEENCLWCFAGRGIQLWTKVKTENLKLLRRGVAAETWHGCVTKFLLWQTQLPEFKQILDRTIFCSSNNQLLHRHTFKVASGKSKLHQDMSVTSNVLKKLTPNYTYLKPPTLSRMQSAYFLPTDHK